MNTVISRTVRSSPFRNTSQTWAAIIELLTARDNQSARHELLSIGGIASSIIAEQALRMAAMVVAGAGPRVRIYCVYDEDAVADSEFNEDPLGYDSLRGDWTLSLPCPADDLAWVQKALDKASTRITARDMTDRLGSVIETENATATDQNRSIDLEAFLRS